MCLRLMTGHDVRSGGRRTAAHAQPDVCCTYYAFLVAMPMSPSGYRGTSGVLNLAAALGAESLPGRLPRLQSPASLLAVRAELAEALWSRGGRPDIRGTTRRQKVPLADTDWAHLDHLAARGSSRGPRDHADAGAPRPRPRPRSRAVRVRGDTVTLRPRCDQSRLGPRRSRAEAGFGRQYRRLRCYVGRHTAIPSRAWESGSLEARDVWRDGATIGNFWSSPCSVAEVGRAHGAHRWGGVGHVVIPVGGIGGSGMTLGGEIGRAP